MGDMISREAAIAACGARLKDLDRMEKTAVFASAKPLIGAAIDEIEIILSALRALPAVGVKPCGGCGNSDPQNRCIGCLHDFGTPESAWVNLVGVEIAEIESARIMSTLTGQEGV